jgi:hypothetical protein
LQSTLELERGIFPVSVVFFKSLGITVVLLAVWVLERIVIMYAAVKTFRSLQFDPTCLVNRPPAGPVVGLT